MIKISFKPVKTSLHDYYIICYIRVLNCIVKTEEQMCIMNILNQTQLHFGCHIDCRGKLLRKYKSIDYVSTETARRENNFQLMSIRRRSSHA